MPQSLDLPALLHRLHACVDAREWLNGKTAAVAWRTCPRGNWLLWVAGNVGVERQILVRAALACARTALPYCTEETVGMVLLCHHIADEWLEGREDLDTLRAAAWAAAWAAARAAGAAGDARDAAVRRSLAECARIVRRLIPYRVMLAAARTK